MIGTQGDTDAAADRRAHYTGALNSQTVHEGHHGISIHFDAVVFRDRFGIPVAGHVPGQHPVGLRQFIEHFFPLIGRSAIAVQQDNRRARTLFEVVNATV